MLDQKGVVEVVVDYRRDRLQGPKAKLPDAAFDLVAIHLMGREITDDLVESLRTSEPLIKTLMDELGATIVKVEPPESLS